MASSKIQPKQPILRVEDLDLPVQGLEDGGDFEDALVRIDSAENLSSRKARFFETQVEIGNCLEWLAIDAAFRNCNLLIGRVGSLDLTGSTLNIVRFDGLKVGYANFVNAKLADVVFSNCRFETLDLFGAKLKNVRFENCTAEELDVRNLEIENADLTGLDFAAIKGLASLRGATISEFQLSQIAGDLAKTAGLIVE